MGKGERPWPWSSVPPLDRSMVFRRQYCRGARAAPIASFDGGCTFQAGSSATEQLPLEPHHLRRNVPLDVARPVEFERNVKMLR